MGMRMARIILTAVLLGGTVASFILDWSPNHLLNPAWPGHARFHGALLLFMLAGTRPAFSSSPPLRGVFWKNVRPSINADDPPAAVEETQQTRLHALT